MFPYCEWKTSILLHFFIFALFWCTSSSHKTITTTGFILSTDSNNTPSNIHLTHNDITSDGKIKKKPTSPTMKPLNPTIDNENTSSSSIVLGSVINIFPRYGYESITMKVLPRNDSEKWLFLEPFKENVFDMSTILIQEKTVLPIAANTANQSLNNKNKKILSIQPIKHDEDAKLEPITQAPILIPKFHNEFHIQLCEDIQELLQAYFRYFSIEGFSRPWNVFTAGWRQPSLIKFMGINSTYTNDSEFFYLFVRISMMHRTGQSIPKDNLTVATNFKHVLNTLQVGNYSSAIKFFNDIGTHYISSYSTGNTIYQVFVYNRYGYEIIKKHLAQTVIEPNNNPNNPTTQVPEYNNQFNSKNTEDNNNTNTNNSDKLNEAYLNSNTYGGILSPYTLTILYYWVIHIGKLMILNSSPSTLEKTRNSLHIPFSRSSNSSIFKLFNNDKLVKKVESLISLEPEGLIGLGLKNIGGVFHNESQREWFLEVLENTMNLWETNL